MGMTANGSATSRGLCRPHPEERACAGASAESKERARISKDEDGHGMGLMLRDASQRTWAVEAPTLASGCDAPRHEGEHGQSRLRSHRAEEPTCGCRK